MPAGTAPNPVTQTVGTIPQTTQGLPPGGPFARYSALGQQQGYVASSQAFGANITLPIPAVSGFLRGFVIKIAATGGTGATTVTAAGDAPWNAISQLTVRDPQNNVIYPAMDGYSLYLINLYSGMVPGALGSQDPAAQPSYSAIQTTSGSGAGDFTFKLWVPLQFNSSGYCALPADNSAETLRLQIILSASSIVYSTAPATLPTMTVTVQEPFSGQPANLPNLAPFDVGASAQWWLTTSGQNPPSNAAMRVLDAAVGQFVHTKIYVYRDSNNARQDFFPQSDLTFYVDNFPWRYENFDDREDEMYRQFKVTRPTGVIVYSWRTSVQSFVSDADDAERLLVTNGSTKIELGGTWQTNSNAPAQLSAITGMVFPGPSGWPYGSQGF